MHKNQIQDALAQLLCAATLILAGCNSASYTVGGTVSGLSADESVTLLDNGGEALIVSGNGGFKFANRQASGSTYDVTVKSQTSGISCSVSNESGTVGLSNVTSVAVSCSAGTESVLYFFKGGATDGQDPGGGLIMDGAGNLYGTTAGGGTNGYGTVFKINAAGTESVVYSFKGGTTDGDSPFGQLIMDSAGNLYGTTAGGGANGGGTVFEITPAGTEHVLHSFVGGTTDGQQPIAGLVVDSAGNLYGTTEYGGTNDDGTVFEITSAGTERVLHSFVGGATDGQQPIAGLVMDSAGNLYGTTSFGGESDDGTVFKIDAAGTESVVYSFKGGTTDGKVPDAGVIMDSAGNLYGTTSMGGANGDGTVFEITAAGTESILHSFDGYPTDGQLPWAGLTMDSAGNLYGTTTEGGANDDGTVFKVSAAGTESILYSFKGGTADGQGPFSSLVIDGFGNLYGTTEGYSYVTPLNGTPVSGSANGDGTVFKIN